MEATEETVVTAVTRSGNEVHATDNGWTWTYCGSRVARQLDTDLATVTCEKCQQTVEKEAARYG